MVMNSNNIVEYLPSVLDLKEAVENKLMIVFV